MHFDFLFFSIIIDIIVGCLMNKAICRFVFIKKRFTSKGENKLINFEEELKKFHPSLEMEDSEDDIYNRDLTDMADLFIKLVRDYDETEQ